MEVFAVLCPAVARKEINEIMVRKTYQRRFVVVTV